MWKAKSDETVRFRAQLDPDNDVYYLHRLDRDTPDATIDRVEFEAIFEEEHEG